MQIFHGNLFCTKICALENVPNYSLCKQWQVIFVSILFYFIYRFYQITAVLAWVGR